MIRIELDHFSLAFGRRQVFTDANGAMEWPGGSGVVGLMGASGSGKTTLSHAILDERYGDGVPGLRAPKSLAIGSVPQQPVLFHHLDVRSNARFFARVGRYRDRFDEGLFASLAKTLRLEALLQGAQSVRSLSGGEAQRIMLLRTLSIRPDLLILDEPSAGLDPSIREAFLVDLAHVISDLGVAALYIGHHWDEISVLAHTIAYLPVTANPHGGTVRTLLSLTVEAFAASPPTPDAFQSVYGPGTSLWPVSQGADGRYSLVPPADIGQTEDRELACFRPLQDPPTVRNFLHAGPFRLERPDCNARLGWVYRDGALVAPATEFGGLT